MNKQLITAALWLMGVISILSMWVVNAITTVSEPYWYIEYTLNGNEQYEAQVITITDNDGPVTVDWDYPAEKSEDSKEQNKKKNKNDKKEKKDNK